MCGESERESELCMCSASFRHISNVRSVFNVCYEYVLNVLCEREYECFRCMRKEKIKHENITICFITLCIRFQSFDDRLDLVNGSVFMH